ncbi:3433_t:CDS:2 [Gigaspora rosea]|nr:3433_t:CDS:2 [Gigaspora rosea]
MTRTKKSRSYLPYSTPVQEVLSQPSFAIIRDDYHTSAFVVMIVGSRRVVWEKASLESLLTEIQAAEERRSEFSDLSLIWDLDTGLGFGAGLGFR